MSRSYTLTGPPRSQRPTAAPRRSGFSPRQQAIYRRIVEDAWKAVSQSGRGLSAATDLVAKDCWYREVLHEKLGVYTSKQLNKSGDFERACAAFEEIAGNSIYWQMRVNAAPLERMRRKLKEIIAKHEIDENYVEGIARQMWDTHPSNLKPEQLNSLLAALQIHFKRQEAAT